MIPASGSWGKEGDTDSGSKWEYHGYQVEVGHRDIFVDEGEQLYRPQPGPAGVCMAKSGHWFSGSCYGCNSGTSLAFAACHCG